MDTIKRKINGKNIEVIRGITPMIKKMKNAVTSLALVYEELFKGNRGIGITREVGILYTCDKLKLDLVIDLQNKGFNALDRRGKKYLVRSRRKTGKNFPIKIGTINSKDFDFLVITVIDNNYLPLKSFIVKFSKELINMIEDQNFNPSISAIKKFTPEIIDY
jgi:hypothetical protein